MKTLVCTQPGSFEYCMSPDPVLIPGNAILRIKNIGICGTDLHAFEGTQPYFEYPRILGHELAAEIVDIDDDSNFNRGDAVTIIPYFNCGQCIACRSGKPNCCVQLKVCGVHIDGGMVEYLSVPISSLVPNRGLGFEALALVEPLAIGAHGVRRAQIAEGEYVLIVGAGPIGLGTIEFARLAGANVIVADINDSRLQFCSSHLNVEHTINTSDGKTIEQLLEITCGDMPTVVFDATGNRPAINQAFQYLAHGGRYVLIGLQKGEISFSHPEFHKREATLMSSRNATRSDFDKVIDALLKGQVNPLTYITHRVGFDKVQNNFSSWLNPASNVIKAMVSI